MLRIQCPTPTLLSGLLFSGMAFAEPPAQEATLPAVKVTAKAEKDKAPAPSEATGSYVVPASAAGTGLDLPLRETPQPVTVVTRARMED
ncbi:MAG TPA: hypothetical protein VK188_05950, partial [Holophaga sp.]|nr:hypothetical protein [Holophaga sp.]